MRVLILALGVIGVAPGCALVLDWDFELEREGVDAGVRDAGPGRDAPDEDAGPAPEDGGGDAGPDAGDAGCPECPPRAIAIAAGSNHTLAIDELGRVWCWGDSAASQCGLDVATTPPTHVGVTGSAVGVAGGTLHSCVRTADAVFCFGQNGSGELGVGTTGSFRLVPSMMVDSEGAQAVSAGNAFTCVIESTMGVACAGTNTVGELGRGSTMPATANTIVTSLVTNAVTVVAGDHHACAIDGKERVLCWGTNGIGQLGRGTTSVVEASPGLLAGGGLFVLLAAGQDHTCGVAESGSIFCWGEGSDGQLGEGFAVDRPAPVEVTGLVTTPDRSQVRLAAGAGHTCALDADGDTWCWGRNNRGQLGVADTITRESPREVMMFRPATEIAAGLEHTCAIDVGGAVWCWGSNSRGQLGPGAAGAMSGVPVRVEFDRD